MSFFSELFEVTKDAICLPFEIGGVLAEGAQELGEIMTDGAKEIIVKGNTNYKTSFETKDEAGKITRQARTKLENAHKRGREKFSTAERLQVELAEKEFRLLTKYNSKILFSFRNSTARRPVNFVECYSPSLDTEAFRFGTFIAGPLGAYLRKDAANSYLEDAKDYRMEVNGIVARIDRTLARLEEIVLRMKEEDRLLDLFDSAVSAGHISHHTAAKILTQLISSPVCDSTGTLSHNYKLAVEELKGGTI